MSYIVIILGASNSGKDTLSNYLSGINIKFSRPQKQALEQWGGLPNGALELDEYRNMELPYTPGKTYLDALIATYHFWKDFAPLANKAGVIKKVKENLEAGNPVIFTDIRMIEELAMVEELGYPIIGARVERPGIESRTSDGMLEILWDNVKISPLIKLSMCVLNDETTEKLQRFARFLETSFKNNV